MNSIRIGTFTKSILLEVAESQGYLTESGIELHEILVPSSPVAFQMLERAAIDVAITSPDNVLAYRYLSKNPLGRNFDLRILGAVDRGLGLSLCYAPDLASGPKSLGVDVPTSGFAFVGYELLALQGIEYGSYSVEVLGSTPKRRTALVARSVEATVLNAGNEIKAISQGAKKMADVSEIGPYLGSVLTAIGKPSRAVLQFRAIIDQVISEILRGKHSTLIIEQAQKNLEVTQEQAREHYKMMIDPTHGFVIGGKIDFPSLKTLIDLRIRYLPTNELDNVPNDISALVSVN